MEVEVLNQVHGGILDVHALAVVCSLLEADGGQDEPEEEREGTQQKRVLLEDPRRAVYSIALYAKRLFGHEGEELEYQQLELCLVVGEVDVPYEGEVEVTRVQAAFYGLKQVAVEVFVRRGPELVLVQDVYQRESQHMEKAVRLRLRQTPHVLCQAQQPLHCLLGSRSRRREHAAFEGGHAE